MYTRSTLSALLVRIQEPSGALVKRRVEDEFELQKTQNKGSLKSIFYLEDDFFPLRLHFSNCNCFTKMQCIYAIGSFCVKSWHLFQKVPKKNLITSFQRKSVPQDIVTVCHSSAHQIIIKKRKLLLQFTVYSFNTLDRLHNIN